MQFSLDRLKSSLAKTKDTFLGKIAAAIGLHPRIDAGLLQDLEDTLIRSDVGVAVTLRLVEQLKKRAQQNNLTGADAVISLLKDEMRHCLVNGSGVATAKTAKEKPHVILVVGVNGTGKTTTIGKLAYHFARQGQKVLLAAADTFRAGAIDQLAIWAGRAGADLVKSTPGADPAAVAFDAVSAALARRLDLVIIDTAGRLHTKHNLMEELKKIKRAITKVLPNASHEVLLVLDATTGQNGLAQAKLFTQAVGVTGLVLTKLDSTAKGGIIFAIASDLALPVKYIGIGEQTDDFGLFEPDQFVEALFS